MAVSSPGLKSLRESAARQWVGCWRLQLRAFAATLKLMRSQPTHAKRPETKIHPKMISKFSTVGHLLLSHQPARFHLPRVLRSGVPHKLGPLIRRWQPDTFL